MLVWHATGFVNIGDRCKLFLLAIYFGWSPSSFEVAPALVVVGFLMIRQAVNID